MLPSSHMVLPSSQPYGRKFPTVNGRTSIRFGCEELSFIGLVPSLDRNRNANESAAIRKDQNDPRLFQFAISLSTSNGSFAFKNCCSISKARRSRGMA